MPGKPETKIEDRERKRDRERDKKRKSNQRRENEREEKLSRKKRYLLSLRSNIMAHMAVDRCSYIYTKCSTRSIFSEA